MGCYSLAGVLCGQFLPADLTRQARPAIRPDVKRSLRPWWRSKLFKSSDSVGLDCTDLLTRLHTRAGLANMNISPHASFWPNDESVFEIWVTVLCGDGLPSITIVLLHYRLIGESLKTTNRNYMRGLGGEGREAGRSRETIYVREENVEWYLTEKFCNLLSQILPLFRRSFF